MNNQYSYWTIRMWQKISLAVLTCFTLLSANAQSAIEAVTGSIQGGSEVIRIDLSQPLAAVPTGFSIQSPARIALDFPGISNGSFIESKS